MRGGVYGIAVALAALAACTTCPQQAIEAPEVAITDSDSEQTLEIVSAAERFANDTCGCSSSSCADTATNEFVEWLRAHPQRSGSAVAAKRVLIAMEKMLLCRDKLAFPEEPLDLDRGA